MDLLSVKIVKMFEINCETLSLASAPAPDWTSCVGDEVEIFAWPHLLGPQLNITAAAVSLVTSLHSWI